MGTSRELSRHRPTFAQLDLHSGYDMSDGCLELRPTYKYGRRARPHGGRQTLDLPPEYSFESGATCKGRMFFWERCERTSPMRSRSTRATCPHYLAFARACASCVAASISSCRGIGTMAYSSSRKDSRCVIADWRTAGDKSSTSPFPETPSDARAASSAPR